MTRKECPVWISAMEYDLLLILSYSFRTERAKNAGQGYYMVRWGVKREMEEIFSVKNKK